MSVATGTISIFGVAWVPSGLGAFVTNAALQNLSIDASHQSVDVINGAGVRVNRTYYGPEQRCSAEFIVIAKSDDTTMDTLPELKALVVLPTVGTIVTISGASAAAFNGSWNFSGKGSIRATTKSHLVMTLELERVGETANAATSLDVQS